MRKIIILSFLTILQNTWAAGVDGPGIIIGVIHRNFDSNVVQVRDMQNRVLEVKASLFKDKGPLYHGKIVQVLVNQDDYKYVRKLDIEKELK